MNNIKMARLEPINSGETYDPSSPDSFKEAYRGLVALREVHPTDEQGLARLIIDDSAGPERVHAFDHDNPQEITRRYALADKAVNDNMTAYVRTNIEPLVSTPGIEDPHVGSLVFGLPAFTETGNEGHDNIAREVTNLQEAEQDPEKRKQYVQASVQGYVHEAFRDSVFGFGVDSVYAGWARPRAQKAVMANFREGDALSRAKYAEYARTNLDGFTGKAEAHSERARELSEEAQRLRDPNLAQERARLAKAELDLAGENSGKAYNITHGIAGLAYGMLTRPSEDEASA